MTVNITINADTLEIYQDGELTSIKAKETEKKDKPESESDWIVRRKLKPQRMSELKQIEDGLYFRRERPGYPWFPWVKAQGAWTISADDELLGPITPDMFL